MRVLSNGLTPMDNHNLRVFEDTLKQNKSHLLRSSEKGDHYAMLYLEGKRSIPDKQSIRYSPPPEFDGCYDEDEWFRTGKMVPPKE